MKSLSGINLGVDTEISDKGEDFSPKGFMFCDRIAQKF
jgi:hypothetical protein